MLKVNIHAIKAFYDNYIWAITDTQKRIFTCVDPGEARPVIEYASENDLTLTHILLTHHHADHIGGVSELQKHFNQVIVYGPIDKRIPYCDINITDGDEVSVDNLGLNFKVIETPGHTLTHVCYFSAKGLLFCGDTLFSGGCGRIFEGTAKQMFHSLSKLKRLPDETKVFCAHEYTKDNLEFALSVDKSNQLLISYNQNLQRKSISLPSSISVERQINPFLRTDSLSIIDSAVNAGAKGDDEVDVFRVMRQLKDRFA
jgi:hydroxyacylglutathione hydrolase